MRRLRLVCILGIICGAPLSVTLGTQNMTPLDDASLHAFLRTFTIRTCKSWIAIAQDDRVRDALLTVVSHRGSGSIREGQDGLLQQELFTLAVTDVAVRRFFEMIATLDRITAAYLDEQIGKAR